MFIISCDYCNSQLDMDYTSSLEEYLHNVDYVKDDIEHIAKTALQTPLLYKCIRCSKVFKYTWKDLELKLRQAVFKDVKRYRKIYVFKNFVNLAVINPDNGLTFCGICDGADNAGNCYKDIINICPFVIKNEA